MIGSMIRRTVMVIAVPAVVAATSASPAMASSTSHYYDDDDNDSVHIKVCKVVKDDDDHSHYYKKYDDDETKFTIHVKTDEDYAQVKVRDGKCKKIKLDYDRPKFRVWEDEEDGYTFKYIKCSDGAYKKNDHTCKFDKDEDHVKVTVYNEKDHSDDDDDDDD